MDASQAHYGLFYWPWSWFVFPRFQTAKIVSTFITHSEPCLTVRAMFPCSGSTALKLGIQIVIVWYKGKLIESNRTTKMPAVSQIVGCPFSYCARILILWTNYMSFWVVNMFFLTVIVLNDKLKLVDHSHICIPYFHFYGQHFFSKNHKCVLMRNYYCKNLICWTEHSMDVWKLLSTQKKSSILCKKFFNQFESEHCNLHSDRSYTL